MTTAFLCALPLLRMVPVVRSSSRTQYNDYWPMIATLIGADGGLRWQGLLEARNQHPIAVPKTVYWVNVLLTDGDNRALGAFVLAVVATTIVGVGVLARGTDGMGRVRRATVTVTAAFLLLAPNGAWSFVKAMSGTAWLTANLLAVGSLIAVQRRRRLLAPGLAVTATITYGTGLAVWPALFVAVLVRDGPSGLRREWPTMAVGGVAIATYAVWYRSASLPGPPTPDVVTLADRVATALGALPADSPSLWLGALAVALALGATVACWRRGSLPHAGPWIGLTCYGFAALVLISLSRTDTVEGRYVSLAAVTWTGVTGIVLLALPRRWWTAVVPVPLVVAATLGTATAAPTLEVSTQRHDLLAAAMHAGVAEGNRVNAARQPFPAITDALRARGHYPFGGDFPMACDAMGQVVPLSDAEPDGRTVSVRPPQRRESIAGGVVLGGIVRGDGHGVDCAVAVDASGRVVGAGPVDADPTGAPAAAGATHTFEVVAPDRPDLRVAVRFDDDPRFVLAVMVDG